MRESILPILKCLRCGSEKSFSVVSENHQRDEIRQGRLICNSCQWVCEIRAGVIDMLPPGKIREEVAREIEGWVKVHEHWFDMSGEKSNFWLVEPDNQETVGISSDEYIRRLPHYDRISKTFQQQEGYKVNSLRELMEMITIQGGERLLDLGAAQCWTDRDFTRLGCRCVATDIVTTKYFGLETSDIYFEEDPGLNWERVRCDMEELPFTAGSFDLVLCNAVLHHTKNLPKLFQEVWRVLTPGGRMLIVNEPDYGLFDRKKHQRAQDEEAAASGANENLYNQPTFIKYLKKAGFQTHFRPHTWLVKYYAWVIYRFFERWGLKSYQFRQWLERRLFANEKLIRRFIGLGTMGIATKPANIKHKRGQSTF